MIISAELLLANKYTPYNNVLLDSNPSYIGSWQRRFTDGEKTAYFVNIDGFDHSRVPELKIPYQMDYISNCQFNTIKKETFNVEYYIRENTTLDDIHMFFEELFYKMECKHYDD